MGNGMVVDPEPPLAAYAADLQPDAPPLPLGGQVHGLPVPSVPDKGVAKREDLANAGIARPQGLPHRVAYALALPGPRDADRTFALPCRLERLLAEELVVVRTGLQGDESPFARKVDDGPRLCRADRVHYRRVRLDAAPWHISLRAGHAAACGQLRPQQKSPSVHLHIHADIIS